MSMFSVGDLILLEGAHQAALPSCVSLITAVYEDRRSYYVASPCVPTPEQEWGFDLVDESDTLYEGEKLTCRACMEFVRWEYAAHIIEEKFNAKV